MKAIYIYPSDIGMCEYTEEWQDFTKKLGYESYVSCVLITVIDIQN